MTSLALACRLGAGSPVPSIPRRVRSILSKYGATLLMPGPAVPLLGPELVVGGSFDSAAGWTLFGDSGAISGGVANLTRTSAYTIFERTIQVEANKNYLVSFESLRASGTGVPVFQLRTASNTAGSVVAAASNASPTSQFATNSVNYTAASSATLYVQAGIGTAAAEVSIDNVSVREIVGYQNTYASFAAGNYRESAGQNPAGVDQQVGFVVDAARAPGPELLSSDGSGNSTTGWSANLGGTMSSALGRVRIAVPAGNADRAVSLAIPTVAGKTYSVSLVGYLGTLAGYWALRVSSEFSGATPIVQTGNQTGVGTPVRLTFTGTGSNIYVTFVAVGSAPGQYGEFNNISVRELPGVHAQQATSGYQPYLRQVPKTLGSELVVNGDFSNGTTGWVGGFATLSVSGGVLNVTATGTASVRAGTVLSTQAGRWYRVTLDIVSGVVTNAVARDGVFPGAMGTFLTTATVSGSRLTFVFLAISSVTSIYTDRVSGAAINDVYQIDNISVREVLEWTYAWQFDGVDDRLSLSAVPFQMADDHFVVAGARPSSLHNGRLFDIGKAGNIIPVISLSVTNTGAIQAAYRDDSATLITLSKAGAYTANALIVASARKLQNNRVLRVNGVQEQASSLSLGAATFDIATIGSRPANATEYASGYIHGVIFGKGAISDSDLLTLERFMASLQGRSL